MNTYDFTAASDFLEEIEATPGQLYAEVVEAMATVSALENKRNRKAASSIWDTLLTCADLLDRITPKETKQAI